MAPDEVAPRGGCGTEYAGAMGCLGEDGARAPGAGKDSRGPCQRGGARLRALADRVGCQGLVVWCGVTHRRQKEGGRDRGGISTDAKPAPLTELPVRDWGNG